MSILSTRQKIFYGTCRVGSSILLNVVSLATFWIYTNHYNLAPVLNGVGNAIGKIVIAISSFYFGYASDSHTESKLGRRKVFIAVGAPILGFSFAMLFIPQLFIPRSGVVPVFYWLIIWNSMFHLFYGFVLTPYQSWMPDIVEEEERLEVSGIQNASNLFASVVGIGYSFFIAGYLEKTGGIEGRTGVILAATILILAVLEVLFFIPALISIKEEPSTPSKRKLKEEMKIIISNRNYLYWLTARGIYSVGLMISVTLILDFIQHVLKFSDPFHFVLTGGLTFGMVIVGFFIWSRIAKAKGKKVALVLSSMWLIFWLPWTLAIGRIAFIPLSLQGYIFAITLGFGMSPIYLFPYAIVADISEKDEIVTKNNRAGIYTGFQAIPSNIFQAIGLVLAGVIRGIADYKGLYWLGPITVGFIILALPFLIKTDLDPLNDKLN